jgi:hypothetical protein
VHAFLQGFSQRATSIFVSTDLNYILAGLGNAMHVYQHFLAFGHVQKV